VRVEKPRRPECERDRVAEKCLDRRSPRGKRSTEDSSPGGASERHRHCDDWQPFRRRENDVGNTRFPLHRSAQVSIALGDGDPKQVRPVGVDVQHASAGVEEDGRAKPEPLDDRFELAAPDPRLRETCACDHALLPRRRRQERLDEAGSERTAELKSLL
jgi:hypothetical protein